MSSFAPSISTVPGSKAATRPRSTSSWIDFLLLSFMLMNLALALDAAQWSPGLDRLLMVTVFSSLAGTAVALSDFRSSFAFFYSIITGIAAILYSLSDLAVGAVSRQEAAYQILQRSGTWVHNAFSRQPTADPLVFVLLLAILLWILGFNASWMYFREQRKWQAILPTGLAMLVNLYYAPHDLKLYFVFYLITAMLLLLRATLNEKQRRWYAEGINFPFDIGFDVMRDGVIFILVVIMLSWGLPTALTDDKNDLAKPWQDSWSQAKEEWHKLFDTLDYGETGAVSSVVFTANHPLGGARSMTNDPVMDVVTPLNQYYQATILDTYTSHSWELRNTVPVNLQTKYRFSPPSYAARRTITQTVTMQQVANVLMAAPMPVDVSVPADVRAIPLELTPDQALTTEIVDVAEFGLLIAHESLQPGQSYTITSSISTATAAQLRADVAEYSPAIRERYLQLPDTVPQRVFDLAQEIAADYDNPYDIAKAIETYLRQYEYNDQIPGPGPEQDAADYFLFEERQGYCDYYATSMAVMLRSLGIPARLVQGYATGEYDPLAGSYRLLEKDAHAWVEVFFPTYGWIQFEPTASEPPIDREEHEEEKTATAGQKPVRPTPDFSNTRPEDHLPSPKDFSATSGGGRMRKIPWRSLLSALGFGLIALLVLGTALFILLLWRRIPRSGIKLQTFSRPVQGQDTIDRIWARILWWASRLGLPHRASQTPAEQAAVLARALPPTAAEIDQLARLYARHNYSPHPLADEDMAQASSLWAKLRGEFLRAWLRRMFRK